MVLSKEILQNEHALEGLVVYRENHISERIHGKIILTSLILHVILEVESYFRIELIYKGFRKTSFQKRRKG